MATGNMITVTEYAKREGISRQTALWRIKKGKVQATQIKLGGTKSVWMISDLSTPHLWYKDQVPGITGEGDGYGE